MACDFPKDALMNHDTCRRIEGSPNFRRVCLTLRPVCSAGLNGIDFVVDEASGVKMVCGRYEILNESRK